MKISIIIPCYNVEEYIDDCIQSIENQTHNSIEVICVDDGSTDKTVQHIERLILNSKLQISLIKQINKGAPSARNKGIELSTGEYLQFLDADDILKPFKLSEQLKLIKSANEPDIVVGSYERTTMEGEQIMLKQYKNNNSESIWLSLMKSDLGITSSNIFRADIFSESTKWNEDMNSSQEYELMFQLLKNGANLIFDSEINTTVRIRKSGSITQQNINLKWERYAQLRIDIIIYIEANKPEAITNRHYQALFESIKMLYSHNKKRALKMYEKIPKNFTPVVSKICSKNYIRLFKLLGFNGTENIRQVLGMKKSR